jgi:hypothetical protein
MVRYMNYIPKNVIRAQRLAQMFGAKVPDVRNMGTTLTRPFRPMGIGQGTEVCRSPLKAHETARRALKNQLDRQFLCDLYTEVETTQLFDDATKVEALRWVSRACVGQASLWAAVDYCWLAAAKHLAITMPGATVTEHPVERLGDQYPIFDRPAYTDSVFLQHMAQVLGSFPPGHPSGTVLEIIAPRPAYERAYTKGNVIASQNLIGLTLGWIANRIGRGRLRFHTEHSYNYDDRSQERVAFRIPSLSIFRAMMRATFPDDPFDIAFFAGVPSRETIHHIRRHELYPLTLNLQASIYLGDSKSDEHPVIFGLHDVYHLALLLAMTPPQRAAVRLLYDLVQDFVAADPAHRDHNPRIEQLLDVITDLELRNPDPFQQLRSEQLYWRWQRVTTWDQRVVRMVEGERQVRYERMADVDVDHMWVACLRYVTQQLLHGTWTASLAHDAQKIIRGRLVNGLHLDHILESRLQYFLSQRDYRRQEQERQARYQASLKARSP